MNTQPSLTIMIAKAVLCANTNGEDCTISYVRKYLEANYKVTNLQKIAKKINQLIDNDRIFYAKFEHGYVLGEKLKKKLEKEKCEYKYVICGQDCNKNFPKIANCFYTYEECIRYLNSVGETLDESDEPDFDITESEVYRTSKHTIYCNEPLFKAIFVDDILIRDYCLHDHEIHIYRIDRNESFTPVMIKLANRYA